jgi:hypothetical protein
VEREKVEQYTSEPAHAEPGETMSAIWLKRAAPFAVVLMSAFSVLIAFNVGAQETASEHKQQSNQTNSTEDIQNKADEWSQFENEFDDEQENSSGADWDDDWSEEGSANPPLSLNAFIELAAGNRINNDSALNTKSTLRDARVQFQGEYLLSESTISAKLDLWYDGVQSQWESQLRELAWQGNLSSLGRVGSHFDMTVGRQVLTWGTGDYVFLNDLFPKDFQSFFMGRDDEYLKAPSTSIKLAGYFEAFNIDVVFTPEFTPDIGITGEVFSFYSPQANQNVAPSMTGVDEPNRGEFAVRVYKTINTLEAAVYGYKGYTKQPTAIDNAGLPRYSKLNVFGASALMPVGNGIANAEYAYYDSIEDPDGTDPFVANSQSRFLIGYSQEIAKNITGSAQWYTEYNHDSTGFDRILNTPESVQEQYRHWVTTRLTWMGMRQTLTLNGFLFYSPSDDDGYLKATMTYSPTDKWQLRTGINVFAGNEPYTFWGQFEDASNVYAAYRHFF